MPESQLMVQTYSGVTVVTFRESSLLDGPAIEHVSQALYALVDEQATRKLLLDFAQVKFLSSSMLGVLIRLQKKATTIKGRVVIAGLRPELMKVFKITKLDRVFEFYDQQDQALHSFGALHQS